MKTKRITPILLAFLTSINASELVADSQEIEIIEARPKKRFISPACGKIDETFPGPEQGAEGFIV